MSCMHCFRLALARGDSDVMLAAGTCCATTRTSRQSALPRWTRHVLRRPSARSSTSIGTTSLHPRFVARTSSALCRDRPCMPRLRMPTRALSLHANRRRLSGTTWCVVMFCLSVAMAAVRRVVVCHRRRPVSQPYRDAVPCIDTTLQGAMNNTYWHFHRLLLDQHHHGRAHHSTSTTTMARSSRCISPTCAHNCVSCLLVKAWLKSPLWDAAGEQESDGRRR